MLGEDHVLLAREVAEERALADPRRRGDLLHRHPLEAALLEEGAGLADERRAARPAVLLPASQGLTHFAPPTYPVARPRTSLSIVLSPVFVSQVFTQSGSLRPVSVSDV